MDTKTNLHYLIAESFFRWLPTIKTEKLSDMGLDAAMHAALNELSVRQQHSISQGASDYLKIDVDIPMLRKRMQAVNQKNEDKALEDDFLIHGATVRMMREYFGMHCTEYSTRRRELGMHCKGQHRPAYCSADIEATVWRFWQTLNEDDERKRLLRVSEASGQPLGTVAAVIQRKSEH